MTEQVLGKLNERNTQSIIWVTLEQAKILGYISSYILFFIIASLHIIKWQ